MQAGKKVYFASDMHLGVPSHEASLKREKKLIRWLDSIAADAEVIYLLGDLFDFWFEYKSVVPKGYTRLFGKLAELRDAGVQIEVFTGNHDIWMFGYFEQEFNIPVHRNHIRVQHGSKKFFIGHGDAIGPGDYGYRFIKSIFTNRVCQWLFQKIHPNLGVGLALSWSRRSREVGDDEEEHFMGEDKERQVIFAKELLKTEEMDYFVFGHRHVPIVYPLGKSKLANCGDWITHFSYIVFDGNDIDLRYFEAP